MKGFERSRMGRFKVDQSWFISESWWKKVIAIKRKTYKNNDARTYRPLDPIRGMRRNALTQTKKSGVSSGDIIFEPGVKTIEVFFDNGYGIID